MPHELQPSELGLEDRSLTGAAREIDEAVSSETTFNDVDEFVDAELVPDPPSPFAFGMKALLGLMAIAGFQFALMTYLTPMIGLMAGIALCVLAMGVLMVSSIIMGLRPGSSMMDQMDRIAIRLVVGIVVLFFGTIIAGGGQMIYMVLEDARFSWKMQNDLGFSYQQRTVIEVEANEPAVTNGQETVGDSTSTSVRNINVLELTSVTTGGAFDQAGIQKGDLIILDGTADDFLQKLDEQRGESIDIPIANYAKSSGQSEIDEATKRSVTIQVPP